MSRETTQQAIRFLLSGGINTAATYFLYLVLLTPLGYRAAYTAAYVAGIALSYVLSTRFVFRVPMSGRSAVKFPLLYLAQYLFGLAILLLSVSWLSIPPTYAALLSIALSVPFTFVLSRYVLVQRAADADIRT